MENSHIWTIVLLVAMTGVIYIYLSQSPSAVIVLDNAAYHSIGKLPACVDQCSFGGIVCEGNEVHYCNDTDGDGCLEDEFITSCVNQDCVDGSCITRIYCGNGACDGNETCGSCPKDCGACPEATVIPITKTCGNGVCESNENCQTCQKDCGYCNYSYPASCGDGYCNGNEDCQSCYSDCGSCEYSYGHSCTQNTDCSSRYCVNNVCRNSATYCGDNYCDVGEDCLSCQADCHVCEVFSFGDAFSSSAAKISEYGNNQFLLLEAGQPYSSITIPVKFNQSAADVSYSFSCSGLNVPFSASSGVINDGRNDNVIGFNKSGIYLRSYLTNSTASPFVLSNGMDTGTHINSIGNGTIRMILFIWSFPNETIGLNCSFGMTSATPSFSSSTSIEFGYAP